MIEIFLYTALGDSITAGENASRPQFAYPSRVVAYLRAQNGGRASGTVLAEPGWTSEALVHAVLGDSMLPLAQSNAISIWVGGDDLGQSGLAILHGANPSLVKTTLARYGRDLEILVNSIRKVSKARIILCSQYNPFPNTPIVAEAVGGLNELTAGMAQRLGTSFAPTHEWFAGREAELIYGYQTGQIQDALRAPVLPIHPNDRGHAVIAEGLAPLVL